MELARDLKQRAIDLDEQIGDLETMLQRVLDRRAGRGKKRRLGDDGAFAGTYGDIARRNSSADLTYENVIMDQLSAQEQRLIRSTSSWVRVDPGEPQYWGELAHVANFQFKNDGVADGGPQWQNPGRCTPLGDVTRDLITDANLGWMPTLSVIMLTPSTAW